MQAFVTVAATALALGLSSPVVSQQQSPGKVAPAGKIAMQPTAPAATAKKAPFVFEAGETELLELVERCGSYLQYNILVDSSELATTGRGRGGGRVRGRAPAKNEPVEETGPIVNLQLPVVTDHDGCEELLSSMLWSHGLALVALDEQKAVYEVLSRNGPRQREIAMSGVRRTPEQVLARPMLRSYVSTVVLLKHINAQLANNALRPFFASSGPSNSSGALLIGNLGNKTSILVSGPQFMVASAVKLLLEADVPETELPTLIEKRFEELAQQNRALRHRIEVLEQQVRAGK